MFRTLRFRIIVSLTVCALYSAAVSGANNVVSELQSVHLQTPTLIRMHVIPNSDHPFDQELKAMVKGDLLSALAKTQIARGDLGFFEALIVVQESLPLIEEVARGRLEALGIDQDVTVRFGVTDYNERTYMGTVVPAGEYISVEVVLGSGRGQNFWCILFPAMCFVPEEVQALTAERSRGNIAEAASPSMAEADVSERTTVQFRWLLIDRLLGRDPATVVAKDAQD